MERDPSLVGQDISRSLTLAEIEMLAGYAYELALGIVEDLGLPEAPAGLSDFFEEVWNVAAEIDRLADEVDEAMSPHAPVMACLSLGQICQQASDNMRQRQQSQPEALCAGMTAEWGVALLGQAFELSLIELKLARSTEEAE